MTTNYLHFKIGTFTSFGIFVRVLKAAWAMLVAKGH